MSETPLNALKERLDRGETALSMVVRFLRTAEVAAIARGAGFHSLYVDLEHAPLSLSETAQICIAAQAAGVTPLVRIPEGRLDLVGTALDGGAAGVIIPHVTTAEEAREAVAAARFPPAGGRSIAGPPVQLDYRPMPPAQVASTMNAAILVVIMIESAEAVENVEAIAAVPGVDMLLVGTNDLTADLGIAGCYDDDAVDRAFAKVLAAADASGIHVGVGGLATRPDLAARYVSRGAGYISVGTDLAFITRGAREAAGDTVAQLEAP